MFHDVDFRIKYCSILTKKRSFVLRGRPFNSWGVGGWVMLKKISCKRLSEEKNWVQHNVIESLWEKREKSILPTRLLEKKNSW